LVDVISASISMLCLGLYLRFFTKHRPSETTGAPAPISTRQAIMPWVILTATVFAWGTPQVKAFLNKLSAPSIPISGLDKLVQRVPPVVAKETAEPAVFLLNWLSASGTAILITAIITGLLLRYPLREM